MDGGLRRIDTGEVYPDVDRIPSLFIDEDGTGVTGRVKEFYEENPFPNYAGLETFGDLVTKGNANAFSKQLLDAIGYNKLILECGCGTGQLSHYLQLNNNTVLGIDMSLSSLSLAVDFKRRNQLERCGFVQMNIFDLAIQEGTFDVVISHGVLHHTMDARRAFGHIVHKLKPGGLVIVGLYNKPARLPTWVRSKLIRLLGPRIDYVVRNRIIDERKADVWVQDQYFNPHETWHSLDEVLGWFAENDVDYLSASPGIMDTDSEGATDLSAPTDPGTRYQRWITQLSWLGTIAREGALFDMIGRKRA